MRQEEEAWPSRPMTVVLYTPPPSPFFPSYKTPRSIMKAQFGRGKPHSPPRVWGCCSLSMHVLQGVSKFLVKWPAKSVQKFPKSSCTGYAPPHWLFEAKSSHLPTIPAHAPASPRSATKGLQKVYKKVHSPEMLCSVTPTDD
jgi:hypothetical protein